MMVREEAAMIVRPVTLEGERAKVAPMQLTHVEELFKAGRSQEIWNYMPMRVKSVDDMRELVLQALASKENGVDLPFVIIDQQSNNIVGSTRFLDISAANRNLEIGWTWLSPEVWRTRINTECKYLLLKHCFEELDTVRVQIKADGRNERSLNAIERIGAKREGTLRKHRIMHDGYIRDTVFFSIIAEEWPEVKERLERLLG
jgi:RimJ/RimL family protein N-acetyltransferase